MLRQALLVLSVLAAACSAVPDAPVEHRGIARQAMVNGKVSPSSQDSVVFMMNGQDGSCSGTLIAPNLVLTARHCVATPPEKDECGTYGATASPSAIAIKVGASSSWDKGSVVAKGKKIFEPTTDNSCGFDAALVLLDRDIPNAKTAKVRFTPLEPNEPTTAVGYGIDQNDNDLPQRMQRSTTVLGVGPAKISYKMKDGKTFQYEAPDGDVVTGESTCSGDSGGPLFDTDGAVVAMTSRGPMDSPTGGIHGKNGCADMVSIYASTLMNKALILRAAKEAGHPISADGSVDTESTKPDTEAGDDDDDDASASGDDDDDDDDSQDSSVKKKKKTSSGTAVAAGGCSNAPSRPGAGGYALLVGLGLAVVSARRRASRS